MIHVTVCTPIDLVQRSPAVLALLNNTRHLGLTTVVLGHEKMWTHYFNFHKILLLDRFLAHLPAAEIVLFTDSFDVCLFADATEEEWLRRFHAMNSPIVFGAEPNCFPPHLRDRYLPSSAAFPFLNSGSFIGYAGALRRVINIILAPWARPLLRTCDQNTYTRFHLTYPGAFKLDVEARLILCTIFPHLLDIGPDFVANVVNGNRPLGLHFNGNKELLPWGSDGPPSAEAARIRDLAVSAGFIPDPVVLDTFPAIAPADYDPLTSGSCRYVVPHRPLPIPALGSLFPREVIGRPSQIRYLPPVLLLFLFRKWAHLREWREERAAHRARAKRTTSPIVVE